MSCTPLMTSHVAKVVDAEVLDACAVAGGVQVDLIQMNTGQRIAIFRKLLNLIQQKLTDKIGINRAYLGHIEAGRQEPSYNFIKALSDSFNINLNWLLAGAGEM